MIFLFLISIDGFNKNANLSTSALRFVLAQLTEKFISNLSTKCKSISLVSAYGVNEKIKFSAISGQKKVEIKKLEYP